MRRVVLIAAVLAAVVAACRTSQPPGTENRMPINSVGPEPVQNVPDVPPGPASPVTAPPPADGGT